MSSFKMQRGVTVRVTDPTHSHYGSRFVVIKMRPSKGTAEVSRDLAGSTFLVPLSKLAVEAVLLPDTIAALDKAVADRAAEAQRQRDEYRINQVREAQEHEHYTRLNDIAWRDALPELELKETSDPSLFGHQQHFGTVWIRAKVWYQPNRRRVSGDSAERWAWVQTEEASAVEVYLRFPYVDGSTKQDFPLPPSAEINCRSLGSKTRPAEADAVARAIRLAAFTGEEEVRLREVQIRERAEEAAHAGGAE